MSTNKENESLTVIVIGAGIGGIATAARLSKHGYKVTIIEKNEVPGGRCGRFIRDGHHFDTGPTLFLMPELYAQTFSDLGESMQDHLDLRRLDPTYHIHFGDGTKLSLSSDLHAMQTQLEIIEPGSFGGFLRYLEEGYLHYNLSISHLVTRNFHSLLEFCTPENFLLLFRLKALIKHYKNIGNYFKDSRLKAAFTFQDVYMGLSPFEAPAIYSLLQYTELADGIWYPMGGMNQVGLALESIADKYGVQFIYNTPVKQINVEGRHTTGVTLSDGQQIQADIIVANADLPYVYRSLLPNDGTADRLKRKRYGCSALIFFWGVKKRYPQLSPHNLFLASDYRQSLNPIFEGFSLPDEPNFYIHAPVNVDPTLAPKGQDTLIAALPVSHIDDKQPQDWTAIQKRARRAVIQRLKKAGISDLDENIKFEISFSPLDWQKRYNLSKGSAHGLSHNLLQMGYLRPRNRHHHYQNLYFVGASTHPGTGLPTVLVSSRLTTECILQDRNNHRSTKYAMERRRSL